MTGNLRWTQTDLTGEGTVGFDDNVIISQNYNTSGGPVAITQTRTANAANEINDITMAGTPTPPAWIDPVYDAAGNMTTMPQPADPTQSFTAIYDSWNRLVEVKAGANTVAKYEYDGRNRRVVKETYTAGVLSETRHVYFTDGWQDIEERVGASTSAERQYVWGVRYIDELVCRDRDTDANGTLDERLYYVADANFNVTALINGSSGAVSERSRYDPYGSVHFYTPAWVTASSSAVDNSILYSGYTLDVESGLYLARNRYLNGLLGTWNRRDPAGYGNGCNLNEAFAGSPINTTARVPRFWPKNAGQANEP